MLYKQDLQSVERHEDMNSPYLGAGRWAFSEAELKRQEELYREDFAKEHNKDYGEYGNMRLQSSGCSEEERTPLNNARIGSGKARLEDELDTQESIIVAKVLRERYKKVTQ